jgi:hypothetical protein
MAFFEELPDQCPPATAADQAYGPAYRIMPDASPKIEHFWSHKLRGLNKPNGVDDCRFCSCSLFTDPMAARAVARLPKMRPHSTHIASVNIPTGAGVSMFGANSNHVDFWMYDTFDMVGAVADVVAL